MVVKELIEKLYRKSPCIQNNDNCYNCGVEDKYKVECREKQMLMFDAAKDIEQLLKDEQETFDMYTKSIWGRNEKTMF